jgi:hypothetical protein
MRTILTCHILLIIMFLPLLGSTQFVTISGKVTDSRNGKILKNVSIFESSSKIGTITNEKGFFKLVLPQGELEIAITDDGFRRFTQQIILKGDTTLSVVLEPEIQNKNRHKKHVNLRVEAKITKKNSDQNRYK